MSEEIDQRILKLKSVKDCEIFANNATKRNRPDLAEQALYKAAQLRKEEYDRGGRRPDIDYHIIGLKNGDKICLEELDITATVASYKTLLYKGRETFRTTIEKELIAANLPSSKIRGKWRIESSGDLIDELHGRIYPK